MFLIFFYCHLFFSCFLLYSILRKFSFFLFHHHHFFFVTKDLKWNFEALFFTWEKSLENVYLRINFYLHTLHSLIHTISTLTDWQIFHFFVWKIKSITWYSLQLYFVCPTWWRMKFDLGIWSICVCRLHLNPHYNNAEREKT